MLVTCHARRDGPPSKRPRPPSRPPSKPPPPPPPPPGPGGDVSTEKCGVKPVILAHTCDPHAPELGCARSSNSWGRRWLEDRAADGPALSPMRGASPPRRSRWSPPWKLSRRSPPWKLSLRKLSLRPALSPCGKRPAAGSKQNVRACQEAAAPPPRLSRQPSSHDGVSLVTVLVRKSGHAKLTYKHTHSEREAILFSYKTHKHFRRSFHFSFGRV